MAKKDIAINPKERTYNIVIRSIKEHLDKGGSWDCYGFFVAIKMNYSSSRVNKISTEVIKDMLGVGDTNLDNYGFFEAQVISQVLQGTKPRSINQRYIQSNGLAINLKTAMQMGWKPPFGLLLTVETAYTTQSPAIV